MDALLPFERLAVCRVPCVPSFPVALRAGVYCCTPASEHIKNLEMVLEQAGRTLGSAAKTVKDAADQGDWKGKVGLASRSI